jgi:hypothetical protein
VVVVVVVVAVACQTSRARILRRFIVVDVDTTLSRRLFYLQSYSYS